MILLVLVCLMQLQASQSYEEVHSNEYLQLSAEEKSDKIFRNCLENTSPADWFSTWKMLGLFIESMCPTLNTKGDEMPCSRNKYIHSVGAVARVKWQNLDSAAHPYTGLFMGADHGIVRLSLAKEPDEDELTTVPGMGLKFLRDGMDSANLVAMEGLDGQDSWNFFKNDFSNHIGKGSSSNLPIKLKFGRYLNHIQQVGLSNWSTHDQTGTPVANPVFPYRLRFHPTGDIQFSDTYTRPNTENLVTIQQGSTLYQIYALDKPKEMGGKEEHIANLVTASKMTTSRWGDRELFFRHQDMADDLKIQTEWKEFTESFGNNDRC